MAMEQDFRDLDKMNLEERVCKLEDAVRELRDVNLRVRSRVINDLLEWVGYDGCPEIRKSITDYLRYRMEEKAE